MQRLRPVAFTKPRAVRPGHGAGADQNLELAGKAAELHSGLLSVACYACTVCPWREAAAVNACVCERLDPGIVTHYKQDSSSVLLHPARIPARDPEVRAASTSGESERAGYRKRTLLRFGNAPRYQARVPSETTNQIIIAEARERSRPDLNLVRFRYRPFSCGMEFSCEMGTELTSKQKRKPTPLHTPL